MNVLYLVLTLIGLIVTVLIGVWLYRGLVLECLAQSCSLSRWREYGMLFVLWGFVVFLAVVAVWTMVEGVR